MAQPHVDVRTSQLCEVEMICLSGGVEPADWLLNRHGLIEGHHGQGRVEQNWAEYSQCRADAAPLFPPLHQHHGHPYH